MKRTYLFSIFLVMSLMLWAQGADIVVNSHIVDAELGDNMPYVVVKVDGTPRTISNREGRFVITVQPTQQVELECAGYAIQRFVAARIPQLVKMKPLSNELTEVTIMPWNEILKKVSAQLNKDLKKKKKAESTYFYRTYTTFVDHELVEAFVQAHSANNLRDISFLRGRRGAIGKDGLRKSSISDMNFHHTLELAPLSLETFWANVVKPFNKNVSYSSRTIDYPGGKGIIDSNITLPIIMSGNGVNTVYPIDFWYSITGKVLTQGDSTIYCIHMGKKDETRQKPVLSGDLYVEAKTLKLLRFDGEVTGLTMEVSKDLNQQVATTDLELHINYRHDHGYTEVADIASTLTSGDLVSRTMLYNVEDLNWEFKDKKAKDKSKVKENMLKTIDEVGFDSVLWANKAVVQRTQEEEKLAERIQMSQEQIDSLNQKHRELAPLEQLATRAKLFGDKIPQEKVYVHMDNTSYFLGDTIWFAAYTRQTNNDHPSTMSGVLYVELLNQDGYLVERKLVRMRNGRGHGNFVIPTDQWGGFYELRAYTRWQLNWGRYQHRHADIAKEWFLNQTLMQNFYRDYDKLYSRTFPVYDKPEEEGEFIENMTTRPMRRYFKKDPHKRKMMLSFFPEGGQLVEGLPCRVAFEARWDDGEEITPSDSVESTDLARMVQNRGRGVVELTPQKGMERTLTFTAKDGQKVEAKLPKAEPQGVALAVTQDSAQCHIAVAMTADLIPDSLALTIMHQGMTQQTYYLEQRQQQWEIPVADLPVGVNQFTVFDTQGRIWADRLCFIAPHRVNSPTIQFEGLKSTYSAYEPVKLQVKTSHRAAGTPLSIAIRDAAHSDQTFDSANMLVEMLLSSEIKSFVPQPEWYFESDDEEHRTGLDLLMMTQGWRRFRWDEMAISGAWSIKEKPEQNPTVKGQVFGYWDGEYDPMRNGFDHEGSMDEGAESEAGTTSTTNSQANNKTSGGALNDLNKRRISDAGSLKKEVLVHTELVSLDGKETRTAEMQTQGGKFSFQMPGYYGQAFLNVAAADNSKWTEGQTDKHIWVQQTTPSNLDYASLRARRRFQEMPADFTLCVDFPYPNFPKPYSYYQQHLREMADPLAEEELLADGVTQLKNVTVRRRRNGQKNYTDSVPAIMIDAYEAVNLATDAGFISPFGIRSIARVFVNDYGNPFPYVDKPGHDPSLIEERYGYDQTYRMIRDVTVNPDSAFMRQNLHSFNPWEIVFDEKGNVYPKKKHIPDDWKWNNLHYIDRYVIYTDYQPRLEGDERYLGSDLPETKVVIYPFVDDARRPVYRDRRYCLPGLSHADDFYHPDYSNRSLDEKPVDHRRTLYWNPDLVIDHNGQANIQFWNTGHQTHLGITAEGITAEGIILSVEEK